MDRENPPQENHLKQTGTKRQWFIRGVAWFGLAVYVPAFLIVLM